MWMHALMTGACWCHPNVGVRDDLVPIVMLLLLLSLSVRMPSATMTATKTTPPMRRTPNTTTTTTTTADRAGVARQPLLTVPSPCQLLRAGKTRPVGTRRPKEPALRLAVPPGALRQSHPIIHQVIECPTTSAAIPSARPSRDRGSHQRSCATTQGNCRRRGTRGRWAGAPRRPTDRRWRGCP